MIDSPFLKLDEIGLPVLAGNWIVPSTRVLWALALYGGSEPAKSLSVAFLLPSRRYIDHRQRPKNVAGISGQEVFRADAVRRT
jgi:hypothetical protein